MIPVHNCADFLREALQSVLCQDPGREEMQIEVIDNCSNEDDPEAIVSEIGGGRVGFHRQPRNVGVIENFNDCIRRATGEWVHILHADDTVRFGFYRRISEGLIAHPEANAGTCRFIHMDESGHWTSIAELESLTPALLGRDFAAKLFIGQRLVSASLVVRRLVYEELGGFRSELPHCADWDMWKRIAFRHLIFYEPEPLACFRVHSSSNSNRLFRTGENVVDQRRSILFSCAELSQQQVAPLYRAAMKHAGIRAIAHARRFWRKGDHISAWHQLKEGLRCSMAPEVMARLLFFFARMFAR